MTPRYSALLFLFPGHQSQCSLIYGTLQNTHKILTAMKLTLHSGCGERTQLFQLQHELLFITTLRLKSGQLHTIRPNRKQDELPGANLIFSAPLQKEEIIRVNQVICSVCSFIRRFHRVISWKAMEHRTNDFSLLF